MTIKVSASLLSGNFARLGEEVAKLSEAEADMIHIDVMDGKFVPNITIGSQAIKSIRPYCRIPFDVHLMVKEPEHHIKDFIECGADILTIHYEATTHLHRTIKQIKACSSNIKVGLALLPSTPPNFLDYIIDELDLILVMTVSPGFGGQQFITSQLKKIKIISDKIKHYKKEILLSVDGGINQETSKKALESGANVLVSGSFLYSNTDIKRNINALKDLSDNIF